MAALEPRDYITSNHRGHGHLIAKGGDVKRMIAEIMGKATGYCKGKGGSMHIANFSLGILGAFGIVGGGVGIGVGAALASKLKGEGRTSVVFGGDGAFVQGIFHEGMNLAAVWNLPVIFLIEDNGYSEGTVSWPKPGDPRKTRNIKNLRDIGRAYGITGVTIDGNDPIAVYEAVKEAAHRARSEGTPSIVHCLTCRQRGHYVGDPQSYRSAEDIDDCAKRDPIPRFRKKLVENGVTKEEELTKIDEEITSEIEEAIRFARESPDPDPEDAYIDVSDGVEV
jgi:pyruvate dehydrogenase E1 component alpha subunit